MSFMVKAYDLALKAAKMNEVPVGAIVVLAGKIIAEAHNEIILQKDPTAHAEILALRRAAHFLNSERLIECDLYVTLEPCPMCAGAISLARLRRVYYGASDKKGGGIEQGARVFSHPTCHHVPEVYSGFMESECSLLLKDFFAAKRQ
jgi:tRNA(adenine34) deaminase